MQSPPLEDSFWSKLRSVGGQVQRPSKEGGTARYRFNAINHQTTTNDDDQVVCRFLASLWFLGEKAQSHLIAAMATCRVTMTQ